MGQVMVVTLMDKVETLMVMGETLIVMVELMACREVSKVTLGICMVKIREECMGLMV
jgi:hypothetical protein